MGGGEALVVDTLGRFIYPSYRDRVTLHEAGHFLVAYLVGLLPRAYTLSAWDAFSQCVCGVCGVAAVSCCALFGVLQHGTKTFMCATQRCCHCHHHVCCRYRALNVQAGTQFCDGGFEGEVAAGRISSSSLDKYSCVALAGEQKAGVVVIGCVDSQLSKKQLSGGWQLVCGCVEVHTELVVGVWIQWCFGVVKPCPFNAHHLCVVSKHRQQEGVMTGTQSARGLSAIQKLMLEAYQVSRHCAHQLRFCLLCLCVCVCMSAFTTPASPTTGVMTEYLRFGQAEGGVGDLAQLDRLMRALQV